MWPVTSEHGGKVDCGPISESMYTECRSHITTALECTSSVTREYMEHGGRLPANCVLTVYYLPVYPPYDDYNYGIIYIILNTTQVRMEGGKELYCRRKIRNYRRFKTYGYLVI
jgi:hypothetical protein